MNDFNETQKGLWRNHLSIILYKLLSVQKCNYPSAKRILQNERIVLLSLSITEPFPYPIYPALSHGFAAHNTLPLPRLHFHPYLINCLIQALRW
jgi:hypothetical protein